MFPMPPKIAVPDEEEEAGSSEPGAGVAAAAVLKFAVGGAPPEAMGPPIPVGGAPPAAMEPPAKGGRPPASAAAWPLDAAIPEFWLLADWPKVCIGGAAALPEMERPLGNTILDNAGGCVAGVAGGIDSAGLCVTGFPAVTTGSPAGEGDGLPALLAHAGVGAGLLPILAIGTGAWLSPVLLGAGLPPGAAESEGKLMSMIGFIAVRPTGAVPAVAPDMAIVG